MTFRRIILLVVALAVLVSGCGREDLFELPHTPLHQISFIEMPSSCDGITSMGNYAYVAGGEAGLEVLDITDPANLELIAIHDTNKYGEGIEVIRIMDNDQLWDIAVVVEATEGLSTYDVTDPANPVSFQQGGGAYDAQKIFIEPGDEPGDPYILYMADSWRGLRIFRSVPGTPGAHTQLLNAEEPRGYTKDVVVKDGFAYVVENEMGVAVYDVSDPDFPELLPQWTDTYGNALGIDIAGNYIFIADGVEGIVIMKINGSDTPEIVASIDLPAYSRSITVRNGWALLAASDGGVHVIDVSDPENPVYSGTVEAGFALDLCVTDSGHVLVADRDDGVFVLGGLELRVDTTAPAKINTLEAEALSFTKVELNWFATGDDGLYGRATSYQIRYLDTPIDNDADWEAATAIENVPAPEIPGVNETMIVDLFSAGEAINFCVRAIDDQGYMSPLGNNYEVVMPEGILLIGGVDQDIAPAHHEFDFEVIYFNSESRYPETANLHVGSNTYEMEYIDGDNFTGATYRKSLFIDLGQHNYFFEFADDQGFASQTEMQEVSVLTRYFYEMGSPLEEEGRNDDEVLHTAGLRDSLVCAPYEVTQAEWTAMGMTNNSNFVGDNLPVETLTWAQALEYCNALSVADGFTPAYDGTDWNRNADGWRLPTEAEWEYLCRAGSTTPFNGENIDNLGWHDGNSGFQTHPVGEKDPNAWGLYDMHGNVREWCWDWYGDYAEDIELDPTGPQSGFQKVVRGGSWHYLARECRSAARGVYYPGSADNFIGLRVVRSVQ